MSGAAVLVLPPTLDLSAADTLLCVLREKVASDRELRIDASKVETMSLPCAQILVSALNSYHEISVEQPSELFMSAFADLGLNFMPERSRGIELVTVETPAGDTAGEAASLQPGQMDTGAMAKRILTIDDSKTIRDMLMVTLSDAGFNVLQAVDGQDGIDVLGRESVDVVITDINMPRMDGYQVIRHLRADPAHKNTPILVLTTESDTEKKNLAREAGATGWMVKPFDPERLIATVCKVSP